MLRELTSAQLEQRQTAAVKHGSYSERRTKPIARTQKRRFLDRGGLRLSDLTGVQRAYLEAWARCQAKVDLIDQYVAEHGLLDGAGEPQPAMKLYVSLANSARLAMAKLEESLRDRVDVAPLSVLQGEGRRVREAAERRLNGGGS